MIKKLLFEFIILVLLFFATWFSLSKIDWMTLLGIEKKKKITEERIGELFWNTMKSSETEITSDSVVIPTDSLLYRICISNHIDTTRLKLHILQKDEINAFALPGHHIVVYSGLMEACLNETEFCGVLCHEMAHIEKGHIMHKLAKDAGLSLLISMTGGKGNTELIREALKNLSSTAYDRSMENEADMTAVDYLIKAHIDPSSFADFLYRLSRNENSPGYLYWISTHPDSRQRSEKIRESIINKSIQNEPVKGNLNWDLLLKKVKQKD